MSHFWYNIFHEVGWFLSDSLIRQLFFLIIYSSERYNALSTVNIFFNPLNVHYRVLKISNNMLCKQIILLFMLSNHPFVV